MTPSRCGSVSHSEAAPVCLFAYIFNYTLRDAALRLPRAATNNARSQTLILIFTLSALACVYQDFMGPLCLAQPVTTVDRGREVRWTTPLLTRLEDSLLCGWISFVSTPLVKLSVQRIKMMKQEINTHEVQPTINALACRGLSLLLK